MSESLYPLRFRPLFRDYLWGGDRLKRLLQKPCNADPPIAESWEIVDHDRDQSIVVNGDLAGMSLGQLMQSRGESLVGHSVWNRINSRQVPSHLHGRFPLLFKFLDACKPLSVQVHPNDAQGARLSPPDLGKTEAWVVLDTEPGSLVYAGLMEGVTRQDFVDAVEQQNTESVLSSFEPNVGDCIFIPAGTVHAIGAGLLMAEIQQASDTTYRLFDWNRVDTNGRPRDLHIAAGLDAIDFHAGPVSAQEPIATSDERCERLVGCDPFTMNRWAFGESTIHFSDQDSFRLVAVLHGQVCLSSISAQESLTRGETIMIPAKTEFEISTSEWTEILVVEPGMV